MNLNFKSKSVKSIKLILKVYLFMEKPIVTALLAYGMSGKLFHAPFVHAHPGFDFKGVLEHNTKKVNADYPAIKSYDSLQEILDDPQIELVIVNTPSNTHVDYSRKALMAGKDILVEKPFAPTVKEAQEIFDLGRKLGRKVMVYQNRRFSSDFAVTRDTIKNGIFRQLHVNQLQSGADERCTQLHDRLGQRVQAGSV
jgi:predicted dehydrogenase